MKRILFFFFAATLFSLSSTQAQCELFFSGYAEGSSNNKFLEIYNPTSVDVSLDGFAFPSVSNAPSTPGVPEYWNTFPEGAVVAAGDVYVIAHGSSDPLILAEADGFHTYLSNGDDGYALVEGTEDNFTIVDMIGTWDADPGSGWEVAGIADGTKDHSLIRKSDVNSGNGGDWAASAGSDADDSEWIVLDQNDWTGLGSHDFTGSCGAAVPGCMNLNATNYDSAATADDGSCTFDNACNIEGVEVVTSGLSFVPADLTVDVGALVFWVNNGGSHNANGDVDTQTGNSFGNPESFYFDIVSGDAEGVCIGSHIFTIPGVYTYDCSQYGHAASGMVGTVTVGVGGCMDLAAPNFNEAASFDDGSCEASPFTAIAEIQMGQETGAFEGLAVLTSGIVTGVYGALATIEDGSGAYSGIWVNGSDVSLQIGDDVQVTATVVESYDLTQLQSPSVTILSQGNELPAAEILATADVIAEQWEGVLVQTTGTVNDDALGYGEWSLDDATGAVRVDDKAYDALGAGIVTLGALVQVTGALDYGFSNFKIQPRDENDVLLYGCTGADADNYNVAASLDDGSCNFTGASCTLFVSEIAEGSSNNKYIELYNPTSSTVFLDQYTFANCNNGCDTPDASYVTEQFDYWTFTFPAGATVAPNSTYIVAHPSADAIIQAVADMTYSYMSNGDDTWGLAEIVGADTVMIDLIGEIGPDPGSGFFVSGIADATKDHTLVRKADVNAGNMGMWLASAGTNEFDGEWIVYDQNDWTNIAAHVFTSGCAADTNGCMDASAANYDPSATTDDGSCIFIPNLTVQDIHNGAFGGQVVTGGIVTAVYDASGSLAGNASYVIQNGTGAFSAIWCIGTGASVGDLLEVSGSVSEVYGLRQIGGATPTILSSENELPAAELLSTSAMNDEQWESVLTQVLAPVSNADAGYGDWLLDDGSGNAMVANLGYDAVGDSVDVDGVMFAVVALGATYRVTAPNFFSYGSWKLVPRNSSDVVRLGCMDSTFVNYDALAAEDDGSCSSTPGCMNADADNYNPLAVVDDGSCVITGCDDAAALNYNVAVTNADNSTCYFTLPLIVINEIHFNPSTSQGDDLDWEFCELYNAGDLSADLSGYEFYNSASGAAQLGLVFPNGTSIGAGEFLILTVSPASTSNYSGNGYQVFEMELGNFSNSGEEVSLQDAFGNVVDAVDYASSGWPGSGFSILGATLIGDPNGGGATLEYIPEVLVEYSSGTLGMDNELGSNWQASWIDGGTPGAANSSAFGCNDETACNFNATAYLADNSTCTYDCYGCTYPDADNFTNGASIDDGTCTFTVGGNDCPADINGDGTVTAADLLSFLSAFGTTCE